MAPFSVSFTCGCFRPPVVAFGQKESSPSEALKGLSSRTEYRRLRNEALEARCSTAQGGGREAAGTLGQHCDSCEACMADAGFLCRSFRALSIRTLLTQGSRARFARSSTLGSTVSSLRDFGRCESPRFSQHAHNKQILRTTIRTRLTRSYDASSL